MSILGWWRKRMAGQPASNSGRALNEAAITARVDLVRLEAFAEAAYEAMREARRSMRAANSKRHATILITRSKPHIVRGCTTKWRG